MNSDSNSLKPDIVGILGYINPQTMPWTTPGTPAPKKGHKRALKAGYEKFREYANSIIDPYWHDFFMTASTGKLPKNCVFKHGQIIFKYRNKESVININESPDEIIKFFNQHLRLKSNADRKGEDANHQLYIETINKMAPKYENWSTIKNNNLKRLMIHDFCKQKKEELKLTDEETNMLQTLLNINISIGTIKDTNIVIVNQVIFEINNLSWNASSRTFGVYPSDYDYIRRLEYLNNNPTPLIDQNHTIFQNESFDYKWEKYLKLFTKQDKSSETAPPTPIYSMTYSP